MHPVLVKPEGRTLAFPFWKNQKSIERIKNYLVSSKVLGLMAGDKKGQRVVVGGWRNSHLDHELGISVSGQRGEGLIAKLAKQKLTIAQVRTVDLVRSGPLFAKKLRAFIYLRPVSGELRGAYGHHLFLPRPQLQPKLRTIRAELAKNRRDDDSV